MKLLAGSVGRGKRQDAVPGGLYLLDLEAQSVRQCMDWNAPEFDWEGRGRETGLRGFAFDKDTLYCVASDELFAFDADFGLVDSWRNPYLKYCRGLACYEGKLFIASSGFDSVIGFDLATKKFDWALQITSSGPNIGGHPFDPASDDGPIMLAKLDLREIYCDASGMYITCEPGLIRFAGKRIGIAVELPPGSHDARPFRDGVVFNDSLAGKLRYSGRGEGEEDRSMRVPEPASAALTHQEDCDDELAKAGYARGLCVIDDRLVAGGSSPAAVSLYDLAANETLLSVRLLTDARTAIHSLAIWPWD